MIFQFEQQEVDGYPQLVPRNWPLVDLKAITSRWQIGMQEKGGWNSIYLEVSWGLSIIAFREANLMRRIMMSHDQSRDLAMIPHLSFVRSLQKCWQCGNALSAGLCTSIKAKRSQWPIYHLIGDLRNTKILLRKHSI